MNQRRLFIASCLSLVATAMAFSIRADIIPALRSEFGFSAEQMGIIAGTGLWGFAVTIAFGGVIIDRIGMKAMMMLAFVGHVTGVILTLFSSGYASLYTATLIIGLANGAVEAVINPLAATIYAKEKTKYLNILHAWWPGGLIVGGLGGYFLTKSMGLDAATASLATVSFGWKIKMAMILVPTAIYGYIALTSEFPVTERVAQGVSYGEMLKECVRPMFILFVFLMMLTASTELGPDQWVGSLLQNMVGIQGILLLVYTAGIMFILRFFFAGSVVKALSPIGVLVCASVLASIGLYLLSSVTTAVGVFLAATVFGIGKTYFWPTMLGFVSERFPKGGALALSLMGGAGMWAVGWLMAPIMGSIQDHYTLTQLSPIAIEQAVGASGKGLDERRVSTITDTAIIEEIGAAKQHGAVMTYRWVAAVPAVLTIIFGLLFFYFRAQGGYHAVSLRHGKESLGTL